MEAYSVSVRLSLINGVSAGLVALSKEFGRTSMAAAELQKRLGSIKRWAIGGAIVGGVGLGILASLKPALDQAKQFQTELAKFSLYGMGDAANAEAERFVKSTDVAGTNFVDKMKMMTEAQGIFRESGKLTLAQQLEGAKIAMPILAKLAFLESSLNDDQRASRHAQDLAMLRFIEARGGANNPAMFSSIADWGYRLQQSSGGVVNWSQMQQLVATAGAAGFNLSQNAISALEPVIADLKGGRVGSGMRVAFQRLLGTQRGLPKQAVSEFLSLGLWDPSKVALNSGGGIKQFLGAPGDVLRDRVKFATDPVAFYTQDFLPAIARKYGPQILGDTAQAKVERAAEISMVFGPGTAGSLFSQIDKLLPAIQRSLDAQNKQQGIGGAFATASATYQGKAIILQKKFDDLLEQAGEAILPAAVQGLSALIPLLTNFSNWAKAHPKLFADLIQGIAGLGIVLTVTGTAMEVWALVKILRLAGAVSWPFIASGMSKLFGAAASLARVAWPFIATGVTKVFNAMGGLETVKWFAIAAGVTALYMAIDKVSNVIGQKTRDRLGIPTPAWLKPGFDPFNFDYSHPYSTAPKTSPIQPGAYHGGAKLQGAVYLDRRRVGEVVARSMAGSMNTNRTSGAGHDGSAITTYVGQVLPA